MQWYLNIFKCDLCIQKHANDAIFASKCNDIYTFLSVTCVSKSMQMMPFLHPNARIFKHFKMWLKYPKACKLCHFCIQMQWYLYILKCGFSIQMEKLIFFAVFTFDSLKNAHVRWSSAVTSLVLMQRVTSYLNITSPAGRRKRAALKDMILKHCVAMKNLSEKRPHHTAVFLICWSVCK